MFQVSRHPKYSQFVIKRNGAGVLPAELAGIYTNVDFAQNDINKYIKLMEEVEAKALERKEKQKEVDKKPLSDIQRKKRNAEKSSTSRK